METSYWLWARRTEDQSEKKPVSLTHYPSFRAMVVPCSRKLFLTFATAHALCLQILPPHGCRSCFLYSCAPSHYPTREGLFPIGLGLTLKGLGLTLRTALSRLALTLATVTFSRSSLYCAIVAVLFWSSSLCPSSGLPVSEGHCLVLFPSEPSAIPVTMRTELGGI